MNTTIVILILLAVIVVWAIGFFNKLQTLKIRIKASIQEIGNQLKRQANLIPNLVESVKGYMKHEKGIYDQITDARKMVEAAAKSNDINKIDQSQEMINKVLGSLKVIVESNPEIKASGLVENLMNELRDTADKLMYARRTVIDLTADYNTAIITIPGVLIANLLGFKEEKGLGMPVNTNQLDVTEDETKNPEIKL